MLVDIINEQVKINNVFFIIIGSSYSNDLLRKIDSRAIVIKLNHKHKSINPIPFIRLNLILLRLKADVIHLHNSISAVLFFVKPAKRIFMTVHSLYFPLKHVKKVSCFIAISQAVKEYILSNGYHNVEMVENGINVGLIKKRANDNFHRKFLIIQVARLDMNIKGQDILIKAISILREKGYTNISVDFIGEGPSHGALVKLSEQLNVSTQVHFLGLRDRSYIYEHLKDYDLMCHPARSEGFGLTVVEGMAARLPVLVPDSGGPYDVIEYGKYGYSFKINDVKDCVNKILFIISHYSEAMKLAIEASEFVENRYSVKRMVEEYQRIYNKHL